jgi:hypothetical protein
MSDKRRSAEQNLGVFLSPSGSAGEGGYLVPMDSLNVGPGEPGPGDEWHMPAAGAGVEGEGTAAPVAPVTTVASPPHPSAKG